MANQGTPKKPLEGIVVLDLAQGIAGPYCGGLFSEFGARVIKVEPPEGDWIRKLGTLVAGESALAIIYNRGKESVGLDLKQKVARDAVLKLAAKSHVFLQSARPGAMGRLGLGFEDIRKVAPDIVYVSVSGYGQTGPNAEKAMVDTVGQATSGLMSMTLARDGSPVRTTAPLVDVLTGLYAFQASSMALWGRKPGDGARHVDISLMQAAAAAQAPVIAEFGFVGKSPGTLNPPAGNYRTKDGWMAVTLVTDAQFRGICEAIGKPELGPDPRFDTFANRRINLPALREILDTELAKRTTAEWEPLFAKAGALASRINNYGDWLADPHVQAVSAAPGFAVDQDTSLQVPRLPGQPAFDAPAPRIGSHTRRVLGELGMANSDIDAWVRDGIAKV